MTDDLKARLTDEQYYVTQEGGTERPFTGIYWDEKADGMYHCVVCDAALFSSDTKYKSGSGWPSYWAPLEGAPIRLLEDRTLGMVRTEVKCDNCGSHLGHVFEDGPQPTGLRYCMNSASLDLKRSASD